MSEVPAPIVLAREVLTREPPPGARARVARALGAREQTRHGGTVRTLVVVLATLVTTTAAAVGFSVVPRWMARHTAAHAAEPSTPPVQDAAKANPRLPHVGPPPASIASPVPGLDLPAVPAPTAQPEPRQAAVEPRSPSALPSAATAAEAETASLLAQQVAAYRDAAALVEKSPGLAVVRLRAFKERWPDSALGEEASVRLVQALVGLGRDADARTHARAFLKRYPASAKRADMAALLGETEQP